MKNKKNNRKTFIIAKMFSGEYLQNGNIGHEIINFFLDDAGDNYVYVTKDGTINKKYDDTVQAVLLTRYRSKGCLEVLGIAEVDRQIIFSQSKDNKQIDEYIKEARRVDEKVLYYGGVDHCKIFEVNKWSQKDKSKAKTRDLAHKITFKTKKFLYPKETTFIYGKDFDSKADVAGIHLRKTAFGRQAPRHYVADDEKPNDYEQIQGLISRKDLWISDDRREYPHKIERMGRGNNVVPKGEITWLDIMGRSNDEITFSNMIWYFLDRDNILLKKFCEEVLKVDGASCAEDFMVEREHENIDIYISSTRDIFVIENKIKSGINGVKDRHSYKNIESQLSKYYRKVNKEADKSSKTAHYYILVPDYRKQDVNEKTMKKYKYARKYRIIYYSELCNFFNKNCNDAQPGSEYHAEFIKMLKVHTVDYYNDQYAEMKRRFANMIVEASHKQR